MIVTATIQNYTDDCRTTLADVNVGPSDIFYKKDTEGKLIVDEAAPIGSTYANSPVKTGFYLDPETEWIVEDIREGDVWVYTSLGQVWLNGIFHDYFTPPATREELVLSDIALDGQAVTVRDYTRIGLKIDDSYIRKLTDETGAVLMDDNGLILIS